MNKCSSLNIQTSIESGNKVESSGIFQKIKFLVHSLRNPSKLMDFFEWKPISTSLLAAIVVAVLAVNVVKAVRVPIISVVLVYSLCLCVFALC